MAANFLEALGELVGLSEAQRRGSLDSPALGGVQRDVVALGRSLAQRGSELSQESGYHAANLFGADRNPLQRALGAAGLAKMVPGTVFEGMGQVGRAEGAAMGLAANLFENQARRLLLAAGKDVPLPDQQALSLSKGYERYKRDVPEAAQMAFEILGTLPLGGAAGANMTARLLGSSGAASAAQRVLGNVGKDEVVARRVAEVSGKALAPRKGLRDFLSELEAATGTIPLKAVTVPFGAAKRAAQARGIGVADRASVARQAVDTDRQLLEQASQVLRAAGVTASEEDVARVLASAQKGEAEATSTLADWTRAVDDFLGPATPTAPTPDRGGLGGPVGALTRRAPTAAPPPTAGAPALPPTAPLPELPAPQALQALPSPEPQLALPAPLVGLPTAAGKRRQRPPAPIQAPEPIQASAPLQAPTPIQAPAPLQAPAPPPTPLQVPALGDAQALAASLGRTGRPRLSAEEKQATIDRLAEETRGLIQEARDAPDAMRLGLLTEVSDRLGALSDAAKRLRLPLPADMDELRQVAVVRGRGARNARADALYGKLFGYADDTAAQADPALADPVQERKEQLGAFFRQPEFRAAIGIPSIPVPEGEVYRLFVSGVDDARTAAQRELAGLRAQLDATQEEARRAYFGAGGVTIPLRTELQRLEVATLDAAQRVAAEGGYRLRNVSALPSQTAAAAARSAEGDLSQLKEPSPQELRPEPEVVLSGALARADELGLTARIRELSQTGLKQPAITRQLLSEQPELANLNGLDRLVTYVRDATNRGLPPDPDAIPLAVAGIEAASKQRKLPGMDALRQAAADARPAPAAQAVEPSAVDDAAGAQAMARLQALVAEAEFPPAYLPAALKEGDRKKFVSLMQDVLPPAKTRDIGELWDRATRYQAAGLRGGGAALAGFAPDVETDPQGNVTLRQTEWDPAKAAVVLGLSSSQVRRLGEDLFAVVKTAGKYKRDGLPNNINILLRADSMERLAPLANAYADLAQKVLRQPLNLWRASSGTGDYLVANLQRFVPVKGLLPKVAEVARRQGAESVTVVEFGQGREPYSRVVLRDYDDAVSLRDALEQTGRFDFVGLEPNAGYDTGFRVLALARVPQQANPKDYPAAASALRQDVETLVADTIQRLNVPTLTVQTRQARIRTLEGDALYAAARQANLPPRFGAAVPPRSAVFEAAAEGGPGVNAVPDPTSQAARNPLTAADPLAASEQAATTPPAQDLLGPLRDAGIDTDRLSAGATRLSDAAQTVADDTTAARAALDEIGRLTGRTYRTVDDFLRDRKAVEQAALFPSQRPSLRKLQQVRGRYARDPLTQPAGELTDQLAVGQIQRDLEPTPLERLADAAGRNPVFRALGQFNRVYRPLALMSPRFHFLNMSDQVFKSVVGEGIAPYRTDSALAKVLNAWEQTRDPTRVTELAHTGIAGKLTSTEQGIGLINAPKVVVDGFGRNLELSLQRVPLLKTLEQKGRALTSYMEEAARLSAYVQGKQRFLLEQLPTFARAVEAAAGPQAASQVLETQGLFGPARLAELLGDVPQRRELIGTWSRLLQAGDEAGAKLSTRIHFNYRYQTNLDSLLRGLLLFHVFSTRNLVYYPQILASHPGVSAAIFNYARSSEESRASRGLTPRMVGATRGGDVATRIAETLYGPNAELLVNPLGYLSGVGQVVPLAKQIVRPDPQKTALGTAITGAGNVGFGLSPALSASLEALNNASQDSLLGNTQRVGGLVPQAQLLNAVASGVSGTPQDVEGPLRQILGGSTGIEAAIRRRVAEMAVEAGSPGAYDAFMVDPNSPVYRQAAEQVARANTLRGLTSFMGGLQVQPLSGGEKTIRQAQRDAGTPTDAYDPNSTPLSRSARQQQTRTALNTELDQLIQRDPQGFLRRLVTEVPAFRGYLQRQGTTPEAAARLDPDALRTLLRAYTFDPVNVGSTPLSASRAYRTSTPVDARQASQAPSQEQQLVQQYLRASPAEKAALLADPNMAYVLTRALVSSQRLGIAQRAP